MSAEKQGTFTADYHVHTASSDGAGSVADVVAAARARKLDAIAITDHDGLESAILCYAYARHQRESAADGGVSVIPGIEISSQIARGGERDVVHIVGLGIDPFAASLQRLCERLQAARVEELGRRLAHVASKGLALSCEAQGRIMERAFWGRGEIARELVLAKRFETVDEAYKACWSDYGREHGVEDNAPAGEAIGAIHDAGGIAVLAHPLRDEVKGGQVSMEDAEERVRILKGAGLDAVEAWYRAFAHGDCLRLESFAEKNSLLVSCGSDHHDFEKRYRLGVTCADGGNYGHRATVAAALGLW